MMTYSQWMNVHQCMVKRRIAEGLYGHWSHVETDRWKELMSGEYHAQLKAVTTK